tara:strand:- start:1802 stop:2743 length:942 start_codon:yes stop_codon:yes gene_type:complete
MKLWIDTDGGVDDALALACAFAAPGLELAGISTVAGNVTARKAARNAALVQSFFAAPHVAIHVGAAGPLAGRWRDAHAVHGEDGLGGAGSGQMLGYEAGHVQDEGPQVCAGHIAGFARRAGAGGVIACLGPLTNLALALRLEPDAFATLGGVICMGGALAVPAARRGGAEFNFSSDLEAVRGVFAAAPQLRIIPLDLCRHVVLRRARLAQIAEAAATPLAHFLMRAHRGYMDAYLAREGIDGCYPHDALVVAALAQPELIGFETLSVELAAGGEFPGLLGVSHQARPVGIGRRIDQRAALNWIEACIREALPH